MNRNTRYLVTGLLLFALLLTSCRRLPKAPPTSRPTTTPTPRSTALPPVATPVPAGSEANPVQIQVVAPESDDGFGVAIHAVEQSLLESSGLYTTFTIVHTDAEALTALCGSPDGTVSVAWLGGLAYAAAYAQGCGSAALQVERGDGDAASSGDKAQILVRSSLRVASVGELSGRNFCRLGYSDVYSWMIPDMMMRAGGVLPTALKSVRDYQDASALLSDLESGTCDAAGLAESAFEQLGGERDGLDTLASSVSVPYLVLVVPPQLPAAEAQALTSALISVGNGSRADTLRLLLNQQQLVEVDDADFAGLRAMITRAGVDLAVAGS